MRTLFNFCNLSRTFISKVYLTTAPKRGNTEVINDDIVAEITDKTLNVCLLTLLTVLDTTENNLFNKCTKEVLVDDVTKNILDNMLCSLNDTVSVTA